MIQMYEECHESILKYLLDMQAAYGAYHDNKMHKQNHDLQIFNERIKKSKEMLINKCSINIDDIEKW